MPVRRNPAHGDPYMAQAAENIASLFKPPSGADALGFQRATAERLEAERIADLYANPTHPDFDRRAIAAGRQTGASSLYAVDANNARALRQTEIERAGALDRTKEESASRLALQFAKPIDVAEGGTTYLPQQAQDATGLPPMLGGQVKMKPGETVITPFGSRLEGAPVPLSMDGAKAAAYAGISPEMQRAFLQTGEGTVEVQTPEGPVVQSRAGALGMPAVPAGDKATEVSRLIAERDRLPAGDTNRKAYDDRLSALGRGQQQGAYDKETDEAFAKENQKIHTGATSARGQLSSLQFYAAAPLEPGDAARLWRGDGAAGQKGLGKPWDPGRRHIRCGGRPGAIQQAGALREERGR